MELDDPTGYGRVVRDREGNVDRIVETKAEGDATPEQLAIREVNTGVYAFDGASLVKAALAEIDTDNAQGELYLPDVLPKLREAGKTTGAHVVSDHTLTLGVNDRVELGHVRKLAQQRIHEAHARNGVTIIDPDSTLIDVGVTIGRDTSSSRARSCAAHTEIGEDCVIGPLTTLIDCTLGDGVSVPHSYLVQRPGRRFRHDRALRLPAAGRASAPEREGRGVRGDQELDHRQGVEGPAPVVHRRHGRGREHEHRRGQHHRELRRAQQAPDDDRRRTCARASTPRSSLRSRSEMARTPPPAA